MDNEKYIELINKYKEHRSLWDPKHKNYHNSALREDAWKEISNDLNIPVKELKTKMKSLMGSYRKEKSRQKQSQVSGSGGGVYISKWFAFAYFDFLSDRDTPGQTVDTLNDGNSCTNQYGTDDEEHSRRSSSPQPVTRQQTLKKRTSKQLSPATKRFRPKSERTKYIEIAVDNLHDHATSSLSNTEDEYETFSKHIAAQLRTLPTWNFVILQEKIQALVTAERLSCLQDVGAPSDNYTLSTRHCSDSEC